MAVTTYTTIDGVIVHEDRGGTERNYVPDTLGSTVALADSSSFTDTWVYWPYGEVRSHSGSSQTAFTYVGTLGYCKFSSGSQMTYVRARMYMASRGRWATVDPLWPDEHPYSYVADNPAAMADPSGYCPFETIGCGGGRREQLCREFQYFCDALLNKVSECLQEQTCGRGTYPGITDALKDLCQGKWNGASPIKVKCDWGGVFQENVCRDGACGGFWGGLIIICDKEFVSRKCPPTFCLLVHELIHYFGHLHGGSPPYAEPFGCLRNVPSCAKYN